MKFFNSIYTLQEISIHHNVTENDLKKISKLSDKKKISKISEEFIFLKKFIPYCEIYRINNKNVYAMPAYIYDLYSSTGMLIDIGLYDKQPDINKKEYWQYNPSITLELNPNDDWEFASELIKDKNMSTDDIWKMFMSGSARINFYQEENTTIQQRIKYAIMEYMLKRPQFYTIDDFIENPILHKKYSKK